MNQMRKKGKLYGNLKKIFWVHLPPRNYMEILYQKVKLKQAYRHCTCNQPEKL